MTRLIATLAILLAASTARAEEFDTAKYDVYRGDTNADGYEDLYFARKDDIVIIASSPIIPVVVEAEESYLLTGSASGQYSSPVLNNSTSLTRLTKVSAGVSYGDFDGDDSGDILVQGVSNGDYSVLLTGTAEGVTPVLLQQFTSVNGSDTSLSSATIALGDANGDDYADFVISWVAGGSTTLLNQGTGQYAFHGPNAAPTIQVASDPGPSAASDEVGVTAGQFRVDESGAATYSIPVLTTPGIAGVTPQVSLNYSSQSGSGIAGKGWSVSGTSAIVRCRQTEETDGSNGRVSFDSNDRYCLDGQRLVSVGATNEYRTEIDTFARIEAVGGSTGDPSYFKVWGKDGSVSEYGNTADSSLNAASGSNQNKTYLWARNEFADSVGNTIDYEYNTCGNPGIGEQLLCEISYAGGAASVEFTYENLPTGSNTVLPAKRYVGGAPFESTQRLKTIKSVEGSTTLRTYTLGYQTNTTTHESQVTSVQECRSSTCYEPTDFTWTNADLGLASHGYNNNYRGFGGARQADLDGDGINELLFTEIDEDSNDNDYYVRIMRWNGSKYVEGNLNITGGRIQVYDDTPNAWWVIDYNNDGKDDLMYAFNGNWYLYHGGTYNSSPDIVGTRLTLGTHPTDIELATIADYNSDGMPDLIWTELVGQNYETKIRKLVRHSGGTVADPYHFETAQALTLDSCYPGFSGSCLIYSQSYGRAQPALADFNGDGVVDLFRKVNFVFEVGEGQPPSYVDAWVFLASTNGTVSHEGYDAIASSAGDTRDPNKHFRFGDFNGDGLTDIAYRHLTNNTWYYRLNTGDGFGTAVSIQSFTTIQSDRIDVVDYNADGYSDIIYPNGGYWQVREWNGNGFATVSQSDVRSNPSGTNIEDYVTSWVDANGDSTLDAVMGDTREHGSHNSRVYSYIRNSTYTAPSAITKISNGFGAETQITYKAINDPAQTQLYSVATDANSSLWGNESPVFDIAGALYAVSTVESSAPRAGSSPGSVNYSATSSISYEYSGAKAQAGGRGFLGFETVASVDDQTNIKTTTTYRQDFPYIGRPVSTEVETSSSQLLSSALNTWDDFNVAGPNRQPYLEEAEEKTYPTTTTSTSTGAFNVGTSALQTVTTTTTMHSQYGQYGDVGVTVIETDGGGDTFTKTTTNTYFAPDLTDWHHGRLKDVTVSHDRTDHSGGSVQRKSSFTYNASTGLLETETVEPSSGNLTLSTTYDHDTYGNRVEVDQFGYRGPQLSGESDPSMVHRLATTTFDSNGRYSTVTKNAYLHEVQRIVSRNIYGSPTLIRDANGNEADVRFGVMGREYWRRDEVGGFTRMVYGLCGSNPCPTGAKYRSHATAAGGTQSYSYFDLLGREIQTASLMFNGDWSIVRQEYDDHGRVIHRSEPLQQNSPNSNTVPSYWTKMVYDDLGRVVRTILPDAGYSSASYNGLTTTMTDPEGKSKTEIKNALGELIRAEDHLNGFVEYTYDEQGNTKSVTQGGTGVTSVVSTMVHDLLGRKTSMNDPDMGTWSYEYNAFGELIEQTTAVGDYTQVSYDRLGRMVSRADYINGGTEESNGGWVYDTATNGLGLLHLEDKMVTMSGTTTTPFRKTYSYDGYSRPASVTTEIVRGSQTESYSQATTYDQFGRVFQQFDASGSFRGLEYTYNAHGYVSQVEESASSATTSDVYYTIGAMDARGNVTQMNKRGMAVVRSFDAVTGRAATITAHNAGNELQQSLTLDFDLVGNLISKIDQSRTQGGTLKNVTETYEYDDLHRLDWAKHGSTTTLDMSYNALGNVTSKLAYTSGGSTDSNANQGTYGYGSGSAGPHAVTSTGGTSGTFTYDANGSMLSGDGRTVGWSVFNKPISISHSGRTVNIAYGPNRSRYERIDNLSQSSEQTLHYIGSVERRYKPGGVTEWKRHLDGELVHTISETTSATTSQLVVLLKDHLGSTDLVMSEAGAILQGMSFDAFGSRRQDTTFASLTYSSIQSFSTAHTTRGFTGHEGLDPVGLVHMNGRVFDPRVGRFLSADPFVQSTSNTQSMNRYSYLLNNPLNATDPSGYFLKKLHRGAMRATGTWAANKWASRHAPWVPGAASTIASFFGPWGQLVSAAISADQSFFATGSLGTAFRSFAGNYVGSHVAINLGGGVLAQAVGGGTASVVQGGKFGHGFVSAGLSSGFARSGVFAEGSFEQVAGAMIVGGTASELTGGKFANGAAYAAFSMALSEGAARLKDAGLRRRLGPERFSAEQQAEIKTEIALAVSDIPEGGFKTEKAAAQFLRARVQGIAENYDVEIGFYIIDNLGSVAISDAHTTFHSWTVDSMTTRPGVASFHTHQTNSSFSGLGGDRSFARKSRSNAYLSNTSGLYKLDGYALHREYERSGGLLSDSWRKKYVESM